MPKAKSQAVSPPVEEKQNQLLDYEVKVYPSQSDGAQRASASVTINGSFAVRGIKVMEGTKGLFVSMPSYRTGNGEYKDIAFPCTSQARKELDQAVLEAYQQTQVQGQNATNQEAPVQQQEQSGQPAMAGM